MSAQISAYLNNTGDRDKVMAIVQFLPLALTGPASDAGCASLSKSLGNLSAMADGYRAITRLALLFNALSKPTLEGLAKPSGDVLIDRVDQLGHFFHVFYCLFENSAVLASHGVYPKSIARLGGCAVTCWFYVLLTGLIREAYVLAKKKNTPEEQKRHIITTVKLGCFFIFSMTCIPKGGPQLLENVSGPLVPLHKALQLIAPKHLPLNDSIRGLLGLIASICDFY
ncbi:putative Gim5a protein [Leptomonas pyrrhocoris]|uniref:Putative Gim5a protein n=1 Tax=Leptomonas pyrrhocoris TaxID=157538 RepID=A0A0M9GAY9_LEPPY|nr:putative Gim5a protein [Leptomonas pyrrhocoris]KPA86439.1 putative Gim5a protein [Leptomonas pyrrhocoris]|eukprot:XP_015664878.1 putative Gim5a protein [Leptomonas pyrrhocoris]